MVYKVYYQQSIREVPVRENTKTIYIEGDSEGNVRKKLIDHGFNIEFVQLVSGDYLDYEKQNEDFKVLEI